MKPVLKETKCFNILFQNALGLAAGFDKNAAIVEALPHFGFGFVEIGTVTPLPQLGNFPPRLLRIPEETALWNRMGFNGHGMEVVGRRLGEIRSRGKLPPHFRIGINIGKNKDTPNERAESDYEKTAGALAGLGDYYVINVSSPNTPGLRDLQTPSRLKNIVRAVAARLPSNAPVLVKLAPEFLREGNFHEWIGELDASPELTGYVLTNTLSHTMVVNGAVYPGGKSGRPVRAPSLNFLKQLRPLTSKPIIHGGGILSSADAKESMKEGATLIQTYTGWIYGGPLFPKQVVNDL